jgi:hypothetical protein
LETAGERQQLAAAHRLDAMVDRMQAANDRAEAAKERAHNAEDRAVMERVSAASLWEALDPPADASHSSPRVSRMNTYDQGT